MRTTFAAVSVLLIVSLATRAFAQTPAEQLRHEEKKLAGLWNVIGAEADGKKMSGQQVPHLKLTFKDGRFSVQMDQEKPQEGTYKIDPSKRPKTIDISRTSGPNNGKQQLGIYELMGNSLKICACETGNDRPTTFDTTDKPGYTVLILRRSPEAR
jgi:uncharacterized protein (TIGR03067 family)